jgi:hypothetical protein
MHSWLHMRAAQLPAQLCVGLAGFDAFRSLASVSVFRYFPRGWQLSEQLSELRSKLHNWP